MKRDGFRVRTLMRRRWYTRANAGYRRAELHYQGANENNPVSSMLTSGFLANAGNNWTQDSKPTRTTVANNA
jgi:hypothetical protein